MAIKAQGATLAVESARASTKAITAITAAAPGQVTATAHGYTNGNVVFLTGIGGMTQLNNRAVVVRSPAANTFNVGAEDTTSYTTYTSGGTAALLTLTGVGSVSGVTGFDGQASEIDVTHLLSTAKEFLLGLQDFGQLTLSLLMDNTDAGQALLRTIKQNASVKGFSLTASDGTICAFMALVKSFSMDMKVDGAVASSVSLRITNSPGWFS